MRNNTTQALRALRRGRRRPSGLGLIELLVALSISAALLTAVAVATDSSFKAYAINEEQSALTQRARLGMHRILTYIRTCKEHQPITAGEVTHFTQGVIATDTGISMFTDSGTELDFEFDATNRKLLLIENGTQREMLTNVEAFLVKMEPMRSPSAIRSGGGCDLLRRATIQLTIKTGGQSADINEDVDGQIVTMSASVMPRRNTW